MTEEEKRLLRERSKEYIYRPSGDPPKTGFHSHFCRICQEDHECYIDDCEFADITICHNCYYKLEEGEINF
jgi:hypothetical protein